MRTLIKGGTIVTAEQEYVGYPGGGRCDPRNGDTFG